MIEIGARPHGDVTRGPSRGGAVSRIDLHLHSTASGLATTWWVRGLGLGQPVRESATAPGDAYALAKDAGMDFVALTDHETIAGGQALRDRPDFLLGEEICAIFPEDGSAVDILVYGLRPEHHAALQDLRGDVYRLVAALRELRLPCALAHPLFLPAGRLNRAMVEKRLLLFGLWETINGARPEPQNRLAARIAATADAVTLRQLAAAHGLPVPPHRRIAGIGGSDDHGGIAVGTTWTALPRVDTVEGVLEALRAGAVWVDGEHGSVDKLVHAGCRIVAAGLAAGGEDSTLDGTPLGQFAGAIPLLGALPTASLRRLVEERQARQVVTALAQPGAVGGVLGVAATLKGVVDAHLALTPWLGVYGYFGREVGKTRELASALALPADRPLRVAVAVDALGATHGVTTFYRGVAAAPVAGIELTLVHADNRPEGVRLRAIGSLPIPLYGDGRLVVPSLLDALETIVAGEFDAVHVATPGPAASPPSSRRGRSACRSSAPTTPSSGPTLATSPATRCSATSSTRWSAPAATSARRWLSPRGRRRRRWPGAATAASGCGSSAAGSIPTASDRTGATPRSAPNSAAGAPCCSTAAGSAAKKAWTSWPTPTWRCAPAATTSTSSSSVTAHCGRTFGTASGMRRPSPASSTATRSPAWWPRATSSPSRAGPTPSAAP